MIWTYNDAQEEEGGIRRVDEGYLEAAVVNRKLTCDDGKRNGKRADPSLGTNSTTNPRRFANLAKDG